jgi:hypothetical protein
VISDDLSVFLTETSPFLLFTESDKYNSEVSATPQRKEVRIANAVRMLLAGGLVLSKGDMFMLEFGLAMFYHSLLSDYQQR